MKEVEEVSRAIIGFIAALVLGAVTWIVRTVFTNQQGLKLLELKQDLQHKEMVAEMKARQIENKEIILELKKLNETMIRAEANDHHHSEPR